MHEDLVTLDQIENIKWINLKHDCDWKKQIAEKYIQYDSTYTKSKAGKTKQYLV